MHTGSPFSPELRFVSLFVPDLASATEHYAMVLGVAPAEQTTCVPEPHPFAKGAPVVFLLGDVALALYQCDGKTTHPGDVGLGLVGEPRVFAERAAKVKGRTFWGPRVLEGEKRTMCITVLPDRHFFEVVSPNGEETP